MFTEEKKNKERKIPVKISFKRKQLSQKDAVAATLSDPSSIPGAHIAEEN